MSELRRLLDDDASGLARELLESAADDAPPRGSHPRVVLAALAGGATAVTAAGAAHAATAAGSAAGGASVGAGAAATKGAGVTALAVAKWLGIGMLAGVATGGALVVTTRPSAPVEHVAVAAPPAAPAKAPAPARVARGLAAAPPEPEAAPAPSAVAPPAASHAADPPDVAAETAVLDHAREALASGDASGALAALADHSRRFKSGVLGPEADVLRIEALVAQGKQSDAAASARVFLAAHADSPHAPHVRALLAKATATRAPAPPARFRAEPASPPPQAEPAPAPAPATTSNVASFPTR